MAAGPPPSFPVAGASASRCARAIARLASQAARESRNRAPSVRIGSPSGVQSRIAATHSPVARSRKCCGRGRRRGSGRAGEPGEDPRSSRGWPGIGRCGRPSHRHPLMGRPVLDVRHGRVPGLPEPDGDHLPLEVPRRRRGHLPLRAAHGHAVAGAELVRKDAEPVGGPAPPGAAGVSPWPSDGTTALVGAATISSHRPEHVLRHEGLSRVALELLVAGLGATGLHLLLLRGHGFVERRRRASGQAAYRQERCGDPIRHVLRSGVGSRASGVRRP